MASVAVGPVLEAVMSFVRPARARGGLAGLASPIA
jgi:hypothetical protein